MAGFQRVFFLRLRVRVPVVVFFWVSGKPAGWCVCGHSIFRTSLSWEDRRRQAIGRAHRIQRSGATGACRFVDPRATATAQQAASRMGDSLHRQPTGRYRRCAQEARDCQKRRYIDISPKRATDLRCHFKLQSMFGIKCCDLRLPRAISRTRTGFRKQQK